MNHVILFCISWTAFTFIIEARTEKNYKTAFERSYFACGAVATYAFFQ